MPDQPWQCPRCGTVLSEPAFVTQVQHPCTRGRDGKPLPAGRVEPVDLVRVAS